MKFLTFLAAAALAVGVNTAQAQITNTTVEEDWGISGFQWDRGRGAMLARYAFFEDNGRVQFCMAYATKGGNTARFNKAALRDAKAVFGDKTLLRNLSFAALHSSRNFDSRLVGLSANCFTTKTAWPSGAWDGKVEWRFGNYRISK